MPKPCDKIIKEIGSLIGEIEDTVQTYRIYGDEFAFDDTSELEYGLPIRSFKSFIHASEEAAISRLYGGIHYMMAIDEGVSQGQKVGDFINSKLQTLKD